MFDLEYELKLKRDKLQHIYVEICNLNSNWFEKAYWLRKYKKAIKQVYDYVNRYEKR